jgi:hypothetical protein
MLAPAPTHNPQPNTQPNPTPAGPARPRQQQQLQLPEELLREVLARAAAGGGGGRTLRSARSACRALRRPASLAVATLLPPYAELPPEAAWRKFPRADGMRVRLAAVPRVEAPRRMAALLARLPQRAHCRVALVLPLPTG